MNENHHHGRIAVLLNSFHRGFALVPEGLDHTANMISWPTREFKRPEDVRRLIACWNAVVGIDTALIEDGRLFAMLAPPAHCSTDAAELFMIRLTGAGWIGPPGDSAAPVQRLLNAAFQEHAPAISLAQKFPSLSRTNSAQEVSFAAHGADFKARMLDAVAFGRQLELENTILRDQLRIFEAAAASRPAPPPAPGDDQAPARTEGAKP
jgi:hypothetical protein